MAARGSRNLDGGIEAIEDSRELLRVKRQAGRVYLKSVVAAAVLTLISTSIF